MARVSVTEYNVVNLGSVIRFRGKRFICVEHSGCSNCSLKNTPICGKLTCSWDVRDPSDPLAKERQYVMFVEEKQKVRVRRSRKK